MASPFPTSAGLRARTPDLLGVAALAIMLMWPAVWNGFPLIFPDSGVYFGIIYGHDFAIDRSSFYGLLLKPVISLLPSVAGLWFGIFVQCLAVAAAVWGTARCLIPKLSPMYALPFLAVFALATSVAWHAGQYMPDAFTGPLVLVVWLAALRDPSADGAAALWLAAIAMALMHYTHLPLLLGVAFTTIACSPAAGGALRSAFRRGVSALLSVGIAAALLIVANGSLLGRWNVAPMGPAFLFARLTEDGLTRPWLKDNCGKTAPRQLCDARAEIPNDSQVLLWSGNSPYTSWLWYPPSEQERWTWIDRLAAANSGAIAARPMAFADNSLRSGIRQFASFQAIDDLCPQSCGGEQSGPAAALKLYRPAAEAPLRASRQLVGTTPIALVRTVTTPVATFSLLLLPVLLWWAGRRKDRLALSLLMSVAAALVINALIAGAFSDIHDRYQSRIIWLVPLAAAVVIARWRQTFRRSRISLPGLK